MDKDIQVIIENERELNISKSEEQIIESTYTYKYNEKSQVKDLYLFLLKKLGRDEYYSEDELQLRFHIMEKEGWVFFRLDYNLQTFIDERVSNDGVLRLMFTMGIPGGMGANVFELANVRINPSEQEHKCIPHVHISPYLKKAPVVRIELETLSQMKSDKYAFNDVFNKKEQEGIMELLKTNQTKLIDYYKRVQRGEYIPHFAIEFRGKIIDFR